MVSLSQISERKESDLVSRASGREQEAYAGLSDLLGAAMTILMSLERDEVSDHVTHVMNHQTRVFLTRPNLVLLSVG